MTGAEHFELFTEGDLLYAAMLAAIAEARHEILLESYIFADDEIGRRFAAALTERARAGVSVRLHLDAAGSLFWASHDLIKQLRRNGLQVRWFHRWSWRHPWRYNRRNHRKLLVVDHSRAYVGGFNIHRENSRALHGDGRWRDTHVGFSGELAEQAVQLFDRFWRGRKRPTALHTAKAGSMLLSNYSRGGRRYLNGTFADMMSHARRSIFLTTPYFVPDIRTQRLLCEAALRGVDVRVLLPRKHDVRIAQWAAHAAYESLLNNGVRIFEYLPRLLHSKTTVVDGNYATIGTSNMDYRSVFLNYELNLFTRDASLCQQLSEMFHEDLQCSEEVLVETWRTRFWGRKFLELVGWLARRLL